LPLQQVVDIVSNPKSMEFLLWDCHLYGDRFGNRGQQVGERDCSPTC
jgi:hypothetical protein